MNRRRGPSPSGRRWREAPDEGRFAHPHLAFGHPLPEGEARTNTGLVFFTISESHDHRAFAECDKRAVTDRAYSEALADLNISLKIDAFWEDSLAVSFFARRFALTLRHSSGHERRIPSAHVVEIADCH